MVQRALDELMAQRQRTTIVIAHRLSTIRAYSYRNFEYCTFLNGVSMLVENHDGDRFAVAVAWSR